MRILSIETSCDETAISIIEASGTFPHANYTILGNALFSQIDIHRQYGGVFPAVAKREHAKTLVPMLQEALGEAGLLHSEERVLEPTESNAVQEILSREHGLAQTLSRFLEQYKKPNIDLIAVTNGPGLEPALWVGINFARALAHIWNIPAIPVNHMEGHILSSIFDGKVLPELAFPAIALLISGGHTELILMRTWGAYEKIGATRDDAVGEAFDKVARMLALPYPGGPEIGRLAAEARAEEIRCSISLPRPMLDSGNLDFSFSGLKTAVRYAVQEREVPEKEKLGIAREFEDAVTTVLLKKTKMAVDQYGAKTIIVGGGVSANTHIRESFKAYFWKEYPMVPVYLPPRHLTTDNSVMIALAGHARYNHTEPIRDAALIIANGNLPLGQET